MTEERDMALDGESRDETPARISPADLRQPNFRRSFRGFAREDVESFLLTTADAYERVLDEADRLRREVATLQASAREHEKALKDTLLAAQAVADDITTRAREDAARLVSDANSRADLVLGKAQARLDDVQRDIDGLRAKRLEASTAVEQTLRSLQTALEYVRGQDIHERAEPIEVRPPGPEAGGG